MKKDKLFVLSTCGTSILTNTAGEEKSLIFKYANEKKEENIPKEDLDKIYAVLEKTKIKLKEATPEEARKDSAELNGILGLYDGQITKNQDIHKLLCTDTFLGEQTGILLKEWLTSNGISDCRVDRHVDLQTNDLESFQLSLSELVKKLSKELPDYQKNKYQIVFNLTGGFKSVQGFLQSIANFYADQTIYIFETANQLLRIPKLPIQMNLTHTVRENLNSFRKLSLKIKQSPEELQSIPQTLLFQFEGEVLFSAWGELIWEESKKEIYQEELFPSPSEKIVYSDLFKKTAEKISKDRLYLINHRIDQLAAYLDSPDKNLISLDFKKLRGNPKPPCTHEFDAWSDLDAKRVFGYYEGEKFILAELDKGLH